MREYLQRKLIKFIIKDVFQTISPDDILTKKEGKFYWQGKEMSDEVFNTIRTQAVNFSQSTLWKILKAELQWRAAKTLLEKGEDGSDIRAAQLMGYITQVIDNKLKAISEESQKA